MSDSIQFFCLEDIFEIIDLDKLCSKQLEPSSHEKVLDYLELEKRRQEIGEKGEQFVYEQEISRLKKWEASTQIRYRETHQKTLKTDMILTHLPKQAKRFILR